MNIQELTTWNRLCSMDLDAADAAFPFSARLARDNGWARAYAADVIEEYRKFCFLAVHAGHPVTPSDEVDQAWHQHLTYSSHYWDALCRDTLERPLHHGPTEGGAAENRKFHDWYERTLASYRRYFGEPPASVWPSATERFDARHDFVRIDRRDVVTIDRSWLRRGAAAALVAGGFVAVAQAIAQTEEARSGAGLGAFVALLLVAAVGVFITFIVVAAKRRHAPHGGRSKARTADAAAAGGFAGCGSSSKHGDGHDGGNGNADGGAGTADGGAGGCGASGCGGGCGGGGS